MALQALQTEVVILKNKLTNLVHRHELPDNTILEATEKLERIYRFLARDGHRQGNHQDWKIRLRLTIHNIEDDIEAFLYKSVQQRQNQFTVVSEICRLFAKFKFYSLRQLCITKINGLLEDQYLDRQEKDSDSSASRQPSTASDVQDKDNILKLPHSQHIKEAVRKLRSRLLIADDEFTKYLRIIPISGPKGAGKTTVVKTVYHVRESINHFECQAWVETSESMQFKDVLYSILKQISHLGLNNPQNMDGDESIMAQAVVTQLSRMRFLIVLDNVDQNILVKLLLLMLDSENGSRIIFITRDDRVAKLMYNDDHDDDDDDNDDDDDDDDDADADDDDDNMIEVKKLKGHYIFDICDGSPLRVSLLQKLISSEERDWRPLTNRATDTDFFELYFNRLPAALKPCFLYLYLFPKGFPIPERRILGLWLSEDLLSVANDKMTTMQPEDIGKKYLREMTDYKLVEVVRWTLDGTPRAYQVNSLLRDAFFNTETTERTKVRVFYNHDKAEVTPKSKDREVDSRWLAEHANIKSFVQSNNLTRSLRSFLSFDTRKDTLKGKAWLTKELGVFLKTLTLKHDCRLLRSLDLEGVYKPYLGGLLHRLLLLRYLGLRSTALSSIPDDVGCLQSLETLDLKHTIVTNLPASIWKLKCLRHLYLNGLHLDEVQFNCFSDAAFLSSIRTLTGLHVVCSVKEDVLVDNLNTLINLTKLGISFQNPESHEVDAIGEWVSTLTNLQSLKLEIIHSAVRNEKLVPELSLNLTKHYHLFNIYLRGRLLKLDVSSLPWCLRVLTLSMSELKEDPVQSLAKAAYQDLRVLRLFAKSYNGQKITFPRKSFRSLLVLKLWKLDNLQELTFEESSAEKLEHLEIRECPNLTRVEGSGKLTSLRKVILMEGKRDKKDKVRETNNAVELEKQIREALTRDKKKETTEKKQDKQKDGRVYFDIRGPPSDSEDESDQPSDEVPL